MLGAFWGKGEWQAPGTLWDSSLLSRPAGCTEPCPASSSPNKAFLFSLRSLLRGWNGTRGIVLLLKSRSLNSHIYSEPHTTSLNLLGTAEVLTRAVPSPWLSFNCRQRGFAPGPPASPGSLQAGLGERIHPYPQRQPLPSRNTRTPSLDFRHRSLNKKQPPRS